LLGIYQSNNFIKVPILVFVYPNNFNGRENIQTEKTCPRDTNVVRLHETFLILRGLPLLKEEDTLKL
jgi:hypothetical protein